MQSVVQGADNSWHSSWHTAKPESTAARAPHSPSTESIPAHTSLKDRIEKRRALYGELTQAIAWKQHSAEYRAICLQTFTIAAQALEKKIEATPKGQYVNLILDIDDNLLECSPYFASMIEYGDTMSHERNNAWWQHGQKQASTPLPGALVFVSKYIHHPKVRLIYLTSRSDHPQLPQWTTEMLLHHGFPVQPHNPVIVAYGREEYSKSAWIEHLRQAKEAHSTLTMGDKLSDSGEAIGKGIIGAQAWVRSDRARQLLGRDHIIMPNPVYGHWDTLTHQMDDFDPDQKKQERDQLLHTDDLVPDMGTPHPQLAQEGRQSLHYLQSANYHGYRLQLNNVIADRVHECRSPSKQISFIAGIDDTVLSTTQWRKAISLKDHISSGPACFHQWARLQQGRVEAGMVELCQMLHQHQVSIAYITDRPRSLATATLSELKQKHLFSEHDHLVMSATALDLEDQSSQLATARHLLFGDQTPELELMINDSLTGLEIHPASLQSDENHSCDSNLSTLGRTRFLCPNPASQSISMPLSGRTLRVWPVDPFIPESKSS